MRIKCINIIVDIFMADKKKNVFHQFFNALWSKYKKTNRMPNKFTTK